MNICTLAALLAGLLLGSSQASTAEELVCIHPIPLTIKELADKHESGALSEDQFKLNTEYLTLKYCAVVDETPSAASSVPLGSGCEMKWGSRLGETVYWSNCEEGLKQVALANINQVLPNEIAVTREIFDTIHAHPFFANAPPISVRGYRINSASTSSQPPGSKFLSDNRTRLGWLRQGFVREDASFDTTSAIPGTAALKSTGHSIQVYAANGLIQLGSKVTTSNRFGTSNTVSRIVAIENLSGRLFPIAVGNEFHYEVRSHYDSVTSGSRFSDDTTTKHSCKVTKRYDASAFHSELKGAGYLVRCDVETRYQKMKSANSKSEMNTVYFDALGTWISADPIHRHEKVVWNGSISVVGKYKIVNTGSFVLKELSFDQ